MSSERTSWGQRFFDFAIAVLLGALALSVAICLLVSIWVPLIIGIAAVVAVVGVVVWWRGSRRYW